MKVKQNNMMISTNFPELNQNSDSPYHFTAKRLIILCLSDFINYVPQGDLPIKYDTASTHSG